jgi:hypothetical protein
MGVILSLKRKQDALAKDTKIQYRGYALDDERLERASKRRKDHVTTPPRELFFAMGIVGLSKHL